VTDNTTTLGNAKAYNDYTDSITEPQRTANKGKHAKTVANGKTVRSSSKLTPQGFVLAKADGQSTQGRHLVFMEDIADKVLDRLSNGESLRSICQDADMPDGSTVRKWISRNPDFARQYAIAREEQADSLFDETIHIADAVPKGAANEDIQRARLQIDTRKWVAGKLRPKKYGDLLKHELTGANGGAIAMQAVSIGSLDYDQREALAGMLEQIALPSPDQDDEL